MASTVPVLLLLFAGIFTTTFADDDDCKPYFTSNSVYKPFIRCRYTFCCGTCDDRYCCSNPLLKLSEEKQDDCFFKTNDNMYVAVGVTIAGLVTFIIMFIICCVCPCCCIYKMCRNPRPVMGATTTTTVISSQYPQQPNVQGSQYPPYQPMIPPQSGYSGAPGYGGQPMPTAPYQGQGYAAGPPPPYQEAGGPGYPAPYSQAAFDGGKAAYPIQPPVQPGFAHPPPPANYSSTQPAYNPAYVEPPKTGY
ncbi:protein shisa-5 [Pseudorasbora parva]|uniref:protein shisa-5 n=1 Tax=Pseudorasbora parva TaxID=51549 RepID=UPI00351E8008